MMKGSILTICLMLYCLWSGDGRQAGGVRCDGTSHVPEEVINLWAGGRILTALEGVGQGCGHLVPLLVYSEVVPHRG